MSIADFAVAADFGAAGHPWTYVAPDTGYPPGWHHVADISVFSRCRSLGIGVYCDDPPTPVRATSWGGVKRLYQ